MKLNTFFLFFAACLSSSAATVNDDEDRLPPQEQDEQEGNNNWLRAAATKSSNSRDNDSVHITSNDGPRVILEQRSYDDGGFGAQSWELFGNEANFAILDRTNVNLPFRIRPGAPWNSFFMDRNGYIGLGLDNGSNPDNPKAKLDVRGDTIITGTLTSPTTDQLRNDLTDSLDRIATLESALQSALERIEALEGLVA